MVSNFRVYDPELVRKLEKFHGNLLEGNEITYGKPTFHTNPQPNFGDFLKWDSSIIHPNDLKTKNRTIQISSILMKNPNMQVNIMMLLEDIFIAQVKIVYI